MSNQLETLEMCDLAKLLHTSTRTIQRRIRNIKLGLCDPDVLPQGTDKSGKWLWLKSVVYQWLSPSPPQFGSLAELATHQLTQNKMGAKK